jgi:hypothetical protein
MQSGHIGGKSIVLGGVLAAGLVGLVTAADVEVIYTKIPGHPTSIVPGAKDAAGNPITVNFRSHNDLVGSPDGTHWLLWGSTHPDDSLGHRFIILGSGTEGTIIAQEELQVPDSDPGVVYDFFPSGVGRFNDANDFVFTARSKNSPLHFRQRVMISQNGAISEWARESDLYTGLLDQNNQPATTAAVGNSIGSVHLLNDGTVGAQDSTIKSAPGSGTNLHSSRRPAIFYDLISFHQNGVTTITNLEDTGSEIWSGSGAMAGNTFFSTPNFQPISLLGGRDRRAATGDSGSWIVRGTVNQPNGLHHVIVVNDKVVLQQGKPIPGSNVVPMGSSALTNPFFGHELIGNGDYYVRGQHDDGNLRWVALNGEVFAVTDDAVPGSVDERWESFTAFSGDRNGNWFLIGSTNHSDPTLNEVVVVNGEIALRKGDQIDLPGHDGDVFIGRANPAQAAFSGTAYLGEDGYLYLFANIYDGDETDYNSDPSFASPTAFIRVQLPTDECLGDLDDNGVVDGSDLLILLSEWGPCPGCPSDLDGNGVVDGSDLLILLANWGPCP